MTTNTTAKIKTGLTKYDYDLKKIEAHDCAVMKIDDLKSDMEMYGLTKSDAYKNICEARKLIKTTHSYKMTKEFKNKMFYLTSEAVEEISNEKLSIIMRDIDAIVKYNEIVREMVV